MLTPGNICNGVLSGILPVKELETQTSGGHPYVPGLIKTCPTLPTTPNLQPRDPPHQPCPQVYRRRRLGKGRRGTYQKERKPKGSRGIGLGGLLWLFFMLLVGLPAATPQNKTKQNTQTNKKQTATKKCLQRLGCLQEGGHPIFPIGRLLCSRQAISSSADLQHKGNQRKTE